MRTIAEILSYNRAYSPHLNDKIFDEDNHMYSDVHDKILEIVDTFMEYAQVEDVKIQDVRLVGSNASYNYNEYSDMDIHIVVDLSKISNPESIAQLYFGEVKHAFKEAYDITIHGIEVELYVEDVNASAITNGIYSVSRDKWIKEPVPMEDPTDEDIERAEEIEDDIIDKLEKATPEEKDDIIDQLYIMRKDGLATEGETAPANLAFKSLRNKGIIQRAKDELKTFMSKKLSLESKKIKESSENSISASSLVDMSMEEIYDYLNNLPVGTKLTGITHAVGTFGRNNWGDGDLIVEKCAGYVGPSYNRFGLSPKDTKYKNTWWEISNSKHSTEDLIRIIHGKDKYYEIKSTNESKHIKESWRGKKWKRH